jgi:PLD-like domain
MRLAPVLSKLLHLLHAAFLNRHVLLFVRRCRNMSAALHAPAAASPSLPTSSSSSDSSDIGRETIAFCNQHASSVAISRSQISTDVLQAACASIHHSVLLRACGGLEPFQRSRTVRLADWICDLCVPNPCCARSPAAVSVTATVDCTFHLRLDSNFRVCVTDVVITARRLLNLNELTDLAMQQNEEEEERRRKEYGEDQRLEVQYALDEIYGHAPLSPPHPSTVSHFDNLRERVVEFMRGARMSLDIAMCYFSDARLVNEIYKILESAREINVRVLLDGAVPANLDTAAQLTGMGCSVRMMAKPSASGFAKMHLKWTIRDGADVLKGSFNFTHMAATQNDEDIIIIQHNSVEAARHYQHSNVLWQQCKDFPAN